MATTTTMFFLLIPVTLCFLLALAAAEQQGKAILVINHKARCKSNFSRIISNTPMQLVINNVTVPGGTGRTTSDGQLLMAVNLNSTEQLAALMSNGSSKAKAFVVAPPHACGAPSIPSGMEVAAAVHATAMVTISDDDDAGSGTSVQSPRPAVAASDTHAATNKGDSGVHLNRLLHNGDPSHLNGGLVEVIEGVVEDFACLLLLING